MGHESKKCWICLYLRSDGVLGYDIILNFTWLEFGMDTLVIITINMKHFWGRQGWRYLHFKR
jgi:hypothetical protein